MHQCNNDYIGKNQASQWRSILTQNTGEFCRNTTIHGLKYVNNKKLFVIDRIYFCLALFIALILATFLIFDAFKKWNTTPVIVSINPAPTYITNEPFPAVTICNLNQALRTKVEQFSIDSAEYIMLQLLCKNTVNSNAANTITNWNGLETFIYNVGTHILYTISMFVDHMLLPGYPALVHQKSYQAWYRISWWPCGFTQIYAGRVFDLSVELCIQPRTDSHILAEVSQPCHDMVIGCQFGAEDFHCGKMFYPIVTDEGLCCVFNMLHPRFMYKKIIPLTLRNISNVNSGGYHAINWYAEQGFPSERPSKYYPRPAQGTGESLGLSLTLDVQANDYYCTSSNSIGFKIALHSPNESPNVRETGVLLAPGWETKLRITPTKIVTEHHLRSVHRKYRNCVFHNEFRLKYFAHYTQRNCEMECLSQLMATHCGCVSFFMPKIDENTTICSIRKSSCVESVRLHTDTSVEYCLDSCLPSCYDLNFDVDAFTAKISSWNNFKIANPIIEKLNHTYTASSIAFVNMYFKEHSFRSNKQTEFIGITDFLSNVGGLMGLFLGFSFLSIAELIYFSLIRPCREFAEFRRQSYCHLLHRESIQHVNKRLRLDCYNAFPRKNISRLAKRQQQSPFLLSNYWIKPTTFNQVHPI